MVDSQGKTSGQPVVGDIICAHGMRVRIEHTVAYESSGSYRRTPAADVGFAEQFVQLVTGRVPSTCCGATGTITVMDSQQPVEVRPRDHRVLEEV